MSFTCPNGCCVLYTREYIPRKNYQNRGNREKAGTVIVNRKGEILIVQSNGNKWGFPKGTVKDYETPFECALRETLEETGIDLQEYSREKFKSFKISGNLYSTFFYILLDTDIDVDIDEINNDSTGIGWISIKCILEIYNNKRIFNRHFRRVFEEVFGESIFKIEK